VQGGSPIHIILRGFVVDDALADLSHHRKTEEGWGADCRGAPSISAITRSMSAAPARRLQIPVDCESLQHGPTDRAHVAGPARSAGSHPVPLGLQIVPDRRAGVVLVGRRALRAGGVRRDDGAAAASGAGPSRQRRRYRARWGRPLRRRRGRQCAPRGSPALRQGPADEGHPAAGAPRAGVAARRRDPGQCPRPRSPARPASGPGGGPRRDGADRAAGRRVGDRGERGREDRHRQLGVDPPGLERRSRHAHGALLGGRRA